MGLWVLALYSICFSLAVNGFVVGFGVKIKTELFSCFRATNCATNIVFTFGMNTHLFAVEFVLDGMFACTLLDHDYSLVKVGMSFILTLMGVAS